MLFRSSTMLPNKGFFDIFRSHLRMRNREDVFKGEGSVLWLNNNYYIVYQ